VVKGHGQLVAEEESKVWRIPGEVIEKIGMGKVLYPAEDKLEEVSDPID
jgi:hypothetical protein